MTTGETANGRSMRELSTSRPRNRWRIRTSAQSTPKIVFRGTAIPTQTMVIQNAWIPSGLVTASSGAERPFSNVRKKIIPSGTTSRAAR
jgi:hypothetical protein